MSILYILSIYYTYILCINAFQLVSVAFISRYACLSLLLIKRKNTTKHRFGFFLLTEYHTQPIPVEFTASKCSILL